MRVIVVLLALTAVAGADLKTEVEPLVQLLGSDSEIVRDRACARLVAYGEDIIPILKNWEHADTEVRRGLMRALREFQRVTIALSTLGGRHSLGTTVRLTVAIRNETEETLAFQATDGGGGPPGSRGGGSWSTLSVVVEGDRPRVVRLRPDQVEILAATTRGDALDLEGLFPSRDPGAALWLRIKLEGEESPLSRPGTHAVRVMFHGKVYEVDEAPDEFDVRLSGFKKYVTEAVRFEARGRSPAKLERLLLSGKKADLASAIQELKVRDDAAIFPLLRKYGTKPGSLLNRQAILRLGAAGHDEDLGFIQDLAEHSADKAIRALAIDALGNFKKDKARTALLRLAWNRRTRLMAVEALIRHKHHSTVSRFIMILRETEGPWTKSIQEALYDWTGMYVEASRREVDRFEKWWINNKAAWAKAQGR